MKMRLLTILLSSYLLIGLWCGGCSHRSRYHVRARPVDILLSLRAANAFHAVLSEVCRERGLDLVYAGPLAWRGSRGMRRETPTGDWKTWWIGTMFVYDEQGAVDKFARVLCELQWATEEQPDSVKISYNGNDFYVLFTYIEGGRRADDVLPPLGMSPNDMIRSISELPVGE